MVPDRETRAHMLSFARRVREARERLDLSVDELARASEISAGAIHRIERGDAGTLGPHLIVVVRLARAMNLSPSELLP